MKNEFGLFIRRARKKRKLKLKDVAQAVGKSPAYICDIEYGRRLPKSNPLLITQLADYLHIPVSLLFKKAGMSNEEGVIEYEQYLKITRSKRRARRIAAGFEAIWEQLRTLKADTRKLSPMVYDGVIDLESSLKELQTHISVG